MVAERERAAFRKWVRFYLDFGSKYGHAARDAASLGLFIDKLRSKRQSAADLDHGTGGEIPGASEGERIEE